MIVEKLFVPWLNHLIDQSGWAAGRLRAFAGKRVGVFGGPFGLDLCITTSGLFEPASGESPDVAIHLPADALTRWLLDRERLVAVTRIDGNAELAELLGQVFRKLHWDAEADLAPLVGDLAAVRLARILGGMAAMNRDAISRLGNNLSEFLVREARLLPLRDEAQPNSALLSGIDTSIGALTERINRLEREKSASARRSR